MKRISFTYQGNELEGLIIQEHDNDDVTIKLHSGYNIIIPKSTMESVKELPSEKQEQKEVEIKRNHSLPEVSILHTGGTIASKVDYETGAVVARFSPEDMFTMFPEMFSIANISSRLLGNMWSHDMRFAHYNIMGRAVLEEINKDVKGVIITHGTDFLHFSGIALSFALENCSIPVVLVGSQRSSDRGSSDAKWNLLGALNFITKNPIPGVFVAMHESENDDSIAIHEGIFARKNHTCRRDAFVSVNGRQFARVKNDEVVILNEERAEELKKNRLAKTSLKKFKEDIRVGWWKAHPQSFVDELKPFDACEGLLIEGSGLGNAPIDGIDEFTRVEHPHIREKIAKLANNIPVAMTSQTIWGRIHMQVYTPQRKLHEMGVLGDGCDMSPELAFIKLSWLLSNYSKGETRELYSRNLRGEISMMSDLEDTHSRE